MHTTPETEMTDQTCTACNGDLEALGPNGLEPIAKCADCGGLHTLRPIFKGALPINLFHMQVEEPGDELRYFDLQWIDGHAGTLQRSHGWYDPDTLNVVQYG